MTRRRRALLAGAVVLVLVLAFAAATARLFVWPSTSELRSADAIVVFGARSRPERLRDGLRLTRESVASVLVLTAPPDDGDVCADRPALEVICLDPEPFTTRGDARVVGDVAAARGWESLVLVTSAYHLARARLLLGRCFDGTIAGHAAEPDDSVEPTPRTLAHEWIALATAVTVQRSC